MGNMTNVFKAMVILDGGVAILAVMALGVFLLLLLLLWFLLPFAVFGLKDLLRDNLSYQRDILKELKGIRDALGNTNLSSSLPNTCSWVFH